MNQYAHIVDLISLWAKYELKVTPEKANVLDFGTWIVSGQSEISANGTENDQGTAPQVTAIKSQPDHSLDSQLSHLLKRIYKFDLMYAKKALDQSELNNYEDFSYLASLCEMENPRKSELISMNLSEFTSGIEVIKRLVKMGLAEERVDPEDRRSKRIMITQKGQKVYQSCLPEMSLISEMLFMHLNPTNKEHLLTLMQPINEIHTKLMNQTKDSSLSEVKELVHNTREEPNKVR